jgi:4-aminobutyrate aminotransferase / (S)-3-amino-2-methylpropionate transaminase
LLRAAQSPEMISALINRPAIGNFPSSRWASDLKDGLMGIAPKGLDQVFTVQSGSEANDPAVVMNMPRYGCSSQARIAIQLDRYQKDSEGFGGCLTG